MLVLELAGLAGASNLSPYEAEVWLPGSQCADLLGWLQGKLRDRRQPRVPGPVHCLPAAAAPPGQPAHCCASALQWVG